MFTNEGGRTYNEDFAAFREETDNGIYIVADGLGGHQHGEVASKCVGNILLEAWDCDIVNDRADWLKNQIEEANQRLMALQQEERSTMKTTLVALIINDDHAAWANVGDSRLYYLRDNKILHMTEDHSVAYKKYRSGQITKAQIGQDEDQSCLLRSLGSHDRWEPDVYDYAGCLKPRDGFLLCSDGLWEYLHDEEILIDYLKAETARDWAELLLLRVIARIQPNSDNLSLLTVMVK